VNEDLEHELADGGKAGGGQGRNRSASSRRHVRFAGLCDRSVARPNGTGTFQRCRFEHAEPISRRAFERERAQHQDDSPQVRRC
jgi:hypothetical protein